MSHSTVGVPSAPRTPIPPCVVCGGTMWTALPDPGPRSIVSDWRAIDEPLARSICTQCGLARRLPSAGTAALYDAGYLLYAHSPGDVREQARQDRYAAWIVETVTGLRGGPANVLDVGCGNGSLLRALRQHWPSARMRGCDPSSESIAHGSGDNLELWRGTAADLPSGLSSELVVTINVIEHTPDPLRFLREVSGFVAAEGLLIVVCPDGSQPGVELLFADHLFSFASRHLEGLFRRAGVDIVATSSAPSSLGAFQMVVGRPAAPRRDSAVNVVAAHVEGREAYLERWRQLDRRLEARMGTTAVCFGVGEAAGLLRAYAPGAWSRVRACTADGVQGGTFGALPVIPLDTVQRDETILLGVRSSDQARVADRLRARFGHVVAWYDLVDGESAL